MNPFPIDAYAYSNRLRRIHPGEKIIFSAATVALCLVFRSPVVSLLALAVISLLLARVAGVPLGAYWEFLRLPTGFIVIGVATIVIVVVPSDGAGALLSLPLGPVRIGVTAASLLGGVRVLSASIGSVGSTLFLALTTPMVDITDQLRRWRVPALFVDLMLLVYRFIFVLLETAKSMHTAQEARLGYSTARRALRSVGMVASNLYLRANARASALFTALNARGYTGDLRVLMDHPAWSRRRLLWFAAADVALLAAGLGARAGGLL